MKTYVFEDTEVKLTGRTASKQVLLPATKSSRTMTLVEITPVTDFDWKKWVNPEVLYEIKTDE